MAYGNTICKNNHGAYFLVNLKEGSEIKTECRVCSNKRFTTAALCAETKHLMCTDCYNSLARMNKECPFCKRILERSARTEMAAARERDVYGLDALCLSCDRAMTYRDIDKHNCPDAQKAGGWLPQDDLVEPLKPLQTAHGASGSGAAVHSVGQHGCQGLNPELEDHEILTTAYLQQLLTQLNCCAHKGDFIGMGLGLTYSHIEALRADSFYRGVSAMLESVLKSWLSQDESAAYSGQLKPATLESLRSVLRSGVVGYGATARDLTLFRAGSGGSVAQRAHRQRRPDPSGAASRSSLLSGARPLPYTLRPEVQGGAQRSVNAPDSARLQGASIREEESEGYRYESSDYASLITLLHPLANHWETLAIGFDLKSYEIAGIRANAMDAMRGNQGFLSSLVSKVQCWAPGDARGTREYFNSRMLHRAVSRLPQSRERDEVLSTLVANPQLENIL